jgi:hypothetical protein
LAEQAGADATRPIARSPRRSPWVRSWCSTTRSIDEIAPRKRKPLALAGASGAVSRYHPASPRPRGSRPHALGTHRVRPGNGGHRRRLPRAEPRGSGRSSEAFFPSSNGPPFHHPRLAGPLPLGTLLFAAFAALRCPLGAYTSPALLSSTTCRLPLALRGPRTPAQHADTATRGARGSRASRHDGAWPTGRRRGNSDAPVRAASDLARCPPCGTHPATHPLFRDTTPRRQSRPPRSRAVDDSWGGRRLARSTAHRQGSSPGQRAGTATASCPCYSRKPVGKGSSSRRTSVAIPMQ